MAADKLHHQQPCFCIPCRVLMAEKKPETQKPEKKKVTKRARKTVQPQ
jgi:hypothetical protein